RCGGGHNWTRAASPRLGLLERTRRPHCRQLCGRSLSVVAGGGALLFHSAPARALSVPERNSARRTLAPHAAGKLAARARKIALPADGAAATAAWGGRL